MNDILKGIELAAQAIEAWAASRRSSLDNSPSDLMRATAKDLRTNAATIAGGLRPAMQIGTQLTAEEQELVRGIHWTADPANNHSGMTLNSEEVAIIAKLLPLAEVEHADPQRQAVGYKYPGGNVAWHDNDLVLVRRGLLGSVSHLARKAGAEKVLDQLRAAWMTDAVAMIDWPAGTQANTGFPDEEPPHFDFTEDGVMFALPTWVRNNEATFGRLLLVGDSGASEDDVAGWTDEQCQQADCWACSVHMSASDNDDIKVPPRPAFVPRRARIFGGTSIMDVR